MTYQTTLKPYNTMLDERGKTVWFFRCVLGKVILVTQGANFLDQFGNGSHDYYSAILVESEIAQYLKPKDFIFEDITRYDYKTYRSKKTIEKLIVESRTYLNVIQTFIDFSINTVDFDNDD